MNKMSRKIVKKLEREKKSLLIALLIGDGTISSNYVLQIQKDGLEVRDIIY